MWVCVWSEKSETQKLALFCDRKWFHVHSLIIPFCFMCVAYLSLFVSCVFHVCCLVTPFYSFLTEIVSPIIYLHCFLSEIYFMCVDKSLWVIGVHVEEFICRFTLVGIACMYTMCMSTAATHSVHQIETHSVMSNS